jgi:protein-ribulosamine 3-kinase
LTAKITAIDGDSKPSAYFLKVCCCGLITTSIVRSDENAQYVLGDKGRQQLEGEFVGMSKLHQSAPQLVPKVLGWGKVKAAVPEKYFLLAEFKEFMPNLLPDPVKLSERVAALHMHPNSVSPTAMFGFPVQTFDGARVQAVSWDPSWTSFFSKLLAEAYRQDAGSNGIWPELETVYQKVQSHLIPRLIGALEREGRSVKPVLIHGDMWDGNIGVEKGTGDPWIFDCAAYYGHNEMELGIWRAERHELRDEAYRREYFLRVEPSEPRKECDDRNLLYSAKTNLMCSACRPGHQSRKL